MIEKGAFDAMLKDHHSLMLETCWEIALIRASNEAAERNFKNPGKIVDYWWDPNTEGSEIVLEELKRAAADIRRDHGYAMLADYVEGIRKEFEDLDPLKLQIVESNDDYTQILIGEGSGKLSERVLDPVNDVLDSYITMRRQRRGS